MKILKIEWLDAAHYTERMPLDQAKALQPFRMFSVGWLIHETDDLVILALEYHEKVVFLDDVLDPEPATGSGFQIIPKGCIITIKELREVSS
jgi:hypothetical protein